MIRFNNLVLLLLFCLVAVTAGAQEDFRKNAPKPGPAPQIEIGDYERFTLDNGLEVIVVENHKLPRVSFQLFVDVPPHLEGEKAGMADMAGQLLSSGTSTRTKAEIDEAIDFIGASLNSSASGLFASSLTKHQDRLLEIFTDVLFNPSFPPDEFEKLKKQTISGLAAAREDPNAIAGNVAQVLRYGADHPYGEIVTEATVENITLEGARDYYETYFAPNISYLVIVGDIDVPRAKTLAKAYFGKWARKNVERRSWSQPQAPDGTQVDFVNKAAAVQSVINITYPVDLKPGSPDAIPASLMNTLLGGYFGSRLNENIREDKGYSYGVGSNLSADKEVGYFNAGGSVRNEVTDSAIVEFFREMETLRNTPPDEEELAMVKSVRTGNFARALEQPQTVANFALNTARYDLPEDYYATYLKKLNAVTPAEIQAVARKYVRPDKAHVLVVGNKGEVADKLAGFAASGEVTFFDIYGNEIKPSAAVVPETLTGQEVVNKYLMAIGTPERLKQVKDLTMKMETSMQGMALEMTMKQKLPDKMLQTVAMNGMTVQETKYDGEKGMVMMQGQKQMMEGEQLDEMKNQAVPFSELYYDAEGYQLELKGIEPIDGQDAYQVEVTGPDGQKGTEFYSTETGFKIREMQTREGPNGTITLTTDYGDYQEVSGILFPHTLKVSGMMPIPMTMNVTDIQVNTGIDDSEFSVE